MDEIRKIKTILKSIPTMEGAGVRLKRAFGYHNVPILDPFLLLDDFHSNNPDDYIAGFPWHPHRGIETITYMLAGDVEHGDSMGNGGVIHSGDVQWMTAGNGIIHQEMPQRQDGTLWGFQLWANLPASHKMMDPRYRDVKHETIPEVKLKNGVTAKIVCGELNGIKGPVQDIITDPSYYDVKIPPNVEFSHAVKEGHTVFVYVIDGYAYFDDSCDPFAYEASGPRYKDLERDCKIKKETLVIYDDGNSINIRTADQPVKFLLISGKPINEPVAWYGPIVMNTQEELRIAFEEYSKGTFIKKK